MLSNIKHYVNIKLIVIKLLRNTNKRMTQCQIYIIIITIRPLKFLIVPKPTVNGRFTIEKKSVNEVRRTAPSSW